MLSSVAVARRADLRLFWQPLASGRKVAETTKHPNRAPTPPFCARVDRSDLAVSTALRDLSSGATKRTHRSADSPANPYSRRNRELKSLPPFPKPRNEVRAVPKSPVELLTAEPLDGRARSGNSFKEISRPSAYSLHVCLARLEQESPRRATGKAVDRSTVIPAVELQGAQLQHWATASVRIILISNHRFDCQNC